MKLLLPLASSMFALTLVGCGDGSDSNSGSVSLLAAPPAQLNTLAPEPAPTPMSKIAAAPIDPYLIAPVAGKVNDSLVRKAALLNLDTAKFGKRNFQGAPGIAKVGNRLWASWTGGNTIPAGEGPGNFIILAYSDDRGATWSREYYLTAARPKTDRCYDPILWLAPDGKLWVIYVQNGLAKSMDGQFGAWAAVIPNPLDTTPTFEPGFWMADGLPEMPFAVRGAWYLPSDYIYGDARFPSRAGKVVFSLDWQNHKVAQVGYVPRSRNADFDESAYVALRNGQVLAQSRSYSGILQSRSGVGTFKFAPPQIWGHYPSAPSRHVLTRSPSGRLVMVWNKNPSRTDMTIALSRDEGKTWPRVFTFDVRGDISYPAVDFDRVTGDILVIYDRGRTTAREIILARINEDKLYRGKPTATIQTVDLPAP